MVEAGKNKNIRANSIIRMALGLTIIILINIISSFLFTRFDLTAEKRYTLSPATKDLLQGVDDIVYFKIYLEGEFPAGFKRLRNSTREMLDEFRAYNKNIQYEFINPSESEDPRERNEVYKLLEDKGLQPTELQVNTKNGREQQIIFPGAVVNYKSSEIALELLQSQMGVPPEEVLNNSVQGLEFKLASTIRKLTLIQKPMVGILAGHGELGNLLIADAALALSDDYGLERVFINGQLNSLTRRDSISEGNVRIANKYVAIIIPKPDSIFSEKDKFIIDQYIMRGGKVLWLIDPLTTSMDSLQNAESTMALARDFNLDDMLFRYGVRLNANLIQDLSSLQIPLRTGQIGNQPQIEFFPWYFFPVINPQSEHPIVRNLNAIKTEFVSSIDTVKIRGVEKTILLQTSPYSRILNAPVLISLSILQNEPDQRLYKAPPQTIAVLLEGVFESNYKNRIPPEISNDQNIGFMAESAPTKMIVVSDGDIIKNQLYKGDPLPLGFDQYTEQTFGNREFLLNAMNYLTDESGLITIRSRELKLRMLDMTKVNNQQMGWQIFSIATPIVLILLLGLILTFLRRRRYAK